MVSGCNRPHWEIMFRGATIVTERSYWSFYWNLTCFEVPCVARPYTYGRAIPHERQNQPCGRVRVSFYPIFGQDVGSSHSAPPPEAFLVRLRGFDSYQGHLVLHRNAEVYFIAFSCLYDHSIFAVSQRPPRVRSFAGPPRPNVPLRLVDAVYTRS